VVELVSDRSEGPYAGVHRFSALEFIARWVDHVPERYEVRVRYCGAYATRRRVWWHRRGGGAGAGERRAARCPRARGRLARTVARLTHEKLLPVKDALSYAHGRRASTKIVLKSSVLRPISVMTQEEV